MNSTEAPLSALAAIVPGTTIPNSAQPSFLLGFLLVLLCNFSTTYSHPALPYLRLLLAIPAYYACWVHGFSGRFELMNRSAALGMALLGTYGGMKVTEICVVGFWNGERDWPRWVRLRTKEERRNGASKQEGDDVIPFEPTILGRLLYAHDLGSASGSSWLTGRAWDWATPAILSQDPTPQPRSQFVLSSLRKLVECYLTMDVCESIVATRSWDSYTPNARPVTGSGIPLAWQLVYATCVCVRTAMGITFPYLLFGLFASLTVNAPLTAFHPLFDAPFASRSLADFWTGRWHPIFRRSFNQISSGILSLIVFATGSPKSLAKESRAGKVVRSIIIFTLSCTEHLILLSALPTDADYPAQPFLDAQLFKFFLAQPLGLTVEFVVVRPLTEGLPGRWRTAVRRAFAWAWLLWSGRYFSDVWFSRGLLAHKERDIVFSPVRGLLKGQWRID